MPAMELYQIKYLLALAKDLHFKKAAEHLCIVQPALSRQIAALENELGFKLFERNKRNVHLTLAGASFCQEVSGVFELIENARKNAKHIHENATEILKIGYVGSALHKALPKFIAQLQKQFPNIKTYLTEMDTAQQMAAVKEGKLDICLSRNPEKHKFLLFKVIQKETFSLVVPAGHRLNKKTFKDLRQGKEEPFILPSKMDGEEYYDLIMGLFKEAGIEPNIAHESVHGGTILKLVESGLGISILPSSFNTGKNPKIVFIDLKQYTPRAELFIVWNKGNQNPVLKKALESIKKNY